MNPMKQLGGLMQGPIENIGLVLKEILKNMEEQTKLAKQQLDILNEIKEFLQQPKIVTIDEELKNNNENSKAS